MTPGPFIFKRENQRGSLNWHRCSTLNKPLAHSPGVSLPDDDLRPTRLHAGGKKICLFKKKKLLKKHFVVFTNAMICSRQETFYWVRDISASRFKGDISLFEHAGYLDQPQQQARCTFTRNILLTFRRCAIQLLCDFARHLHEELHLHVLTLFPLCSTIAGKYNMVTIHLSFVDL